MGGPLALPRLLVSIVGLCLSCDKLKPSLAAHSDPWGGPIESELRAAGPTVTTRGQEAPRHPSIHGLWTAALQLLWKRVLHAQVVRAARNPLGNPAEKTKLCLLSDFASFHKKLSFRWWRGVA